MDELLVIEEVYGHWIQLMSARRMTEDEGKRQKILPEHVSSLFVGLGDNRNRITLSYIRHDDLPKREADGEFMGGGNRAYIISQQEWDRYVALNKLREQEAKRRALRSEIESCMKLKGQAERQMPLPSRDEAEAKRKYWIETQNGGGEGYVPHFFCQEEYDDLCRRLNYLMGAEESMLNPEELLS